MQLSLNKPFSLKITTRKYLISLELSVCLVHELSLSELCFDSLSCKELLLGQLVLDTRSPQMGACLNVAEGSMI